MDYLKSTNPNLMFLAPVSEQEIEIIIQSLNPKKTIGPYSIPSACLEFGGGGGASRVPSLQATLPPSPQIFSVISDTSCHTPYLFFKNTNCVTPPPNNLC